MASKIVKCEETDDGSLTPSEPSDGERSDHDSDYETEHEEEETEGEQLPNIAWTGYGKKIPVIMFRGEVAIKKRSDFKAVGERYHMAYKMGSSDCRIIRTILNTHGFKEVHPNSSDYNIMWTGSHLKPFTLRGLTEFQKINHFPRSYEITRKDRLFKNVQRMQQIKGSKHFDFVAQSYIMPSEYQDFCSCFMKEKGTWIVKPVASSRGRGVFLINHPDQVPLDENLIVSKYISNPILIDGFKFDVRLYIAVTSYDPIVIYLYEEGLTRFATVKYEKANKHIRNQCMHLTNYSVNKKNKDYVQNDDPDIEDYGNKWSLGALLRYLKSQKRDVTALMMRIEDVVIKTILSAELPIATACKMFMPFRGNCFELYGFDILIDENLKPWVLEVNLSPSLACDAPLDLKIKANMISDLLSVSGLICQDPMLRTLQQSRRNQELSSRIGGRTKSAHFRSMPSYKLKTRPQSAGNKGSVEGRKVTIEKQTSQSMVGLSSEEIKIVRRVKEEEQRKGGWVRIFPSSDSWDLYGPFLQFSTTHNAMLHQRLYPERHKNLVNPLASKSSTTSLGLRNKNVYSQLSSTPLSKLDFQGDAYSHASVRTRQYLRKLTGSGDTKRKNRRRKLKSATQSAKQSASRRRLVQGVMEEGEEEEYGEDLETESVEQLMKVDPRVSKEISRPQTPADKQSSSEKSPPVAECQPPPAKETSPKLNLLEMLVTGEGALNKVQARTAFAMYLIRVQQRLLAECNSNNADDMEALNEQMDLVLRFLKRAAVNLQQSFKVIVPSRKLPLNDRRRILAKQLGNFVHIYTKETDQLKERQDSDKRGVKRTPSKESLNEEKFEKFINLASEAELEEVLTTYTKLNKSASIFLGTKSPDKTSSGTETNKHQTVLPKRKEQASSYSDVSKPLVLDTPDSQTQPPPPTFIGWEEIHHGAKAHTIHIDSRGGERKMMSRPGSGRNTPAAVYATPTAAAFANAVAIYSTKLTRSRPSSASSYKSGVRVTSHRPSSAVSSRASSASRSERGYVDEYNEKAINEALQRLAARQQARQYSATNSLAGFSDLPNPQGNLSRTSSQQSLTTVFRTRSHSTGDMISSQTSDHVTHSRVERHPEEGKYVAIEEHKQNSLPPSGVQGRHVTRNGRDSSIKTDGKHNHFKKVDIVDDTWQNKPHLNLAPNSVAGVNSGYASHGNKTYKITQQQQLIKQQRLMAQSKALLESSKAKHLAMVAQAHAAQNLSASTKPVPITTVYTDPQPFEPRPPSQPLSIKKPNSQHRISRTLSGDYSVEPNLNSSRPRHSIHRKSYGSLLPDQNVSYVPDIDSPDHTSAGLAAQGAVLQGRDI